MEMQDIVIKFPEIKLVIGNTVMHLLGPCTISADEAKKIKSAIKSNIPRDAIFWDMKQEIIRELGKGIDIELADGTVVSLAMNHQHGWQFDIPISTSMINKATGQHVPVTYAAFVHNALYKLEHDDVFSVSTKAKATLIELGYIINGDYTITKAGKAVLDRLAKVDPSTDSSCRMKLTRAMFCRNDPTLPAFYWLQQNGFIEYVKTFTMPRQPWYVLDQSASRGACWYPTRIGAEWLEKNAIRILKHHSASRTRKIDMIPFMPLDHLSEYLSSTDIGVRELAEYRLHVIKGTKGGKSIGAQ